MCLITPGCGAETWPSYKNRICWSQRLVNTQDCKTSYLANIVASYGIETCGYWGRGAAKGSESLPYRAWDCSWGCLHTSGRESSFGAEFRVGQTREERRKNDWGAPEVLHPGVYLCSFPRGSGLDSKSPTKKAAMLGNHGEGLDIIDHSAFMT